MQEREEKKERRYWALHTYISQAMKTPVAAEPCSAPETTSTVGELFRAADLAPEVGHALLLGDLQLMQVALTQGGHRGALCWQPNRETPFVLRLASVTLSLRHAPLASPQDRLSLLAADGSLRPVTPEDLEFYAREFITPASPNLVPLRTTSEISESLQERCREHAACTEQLDVDREDVRTERRWLILVALVCLLSCVPALIWGEPLTAAATTTLGAALLAYLSVRLRRARTDEAHTRQRQTDLESKVLLALGQIPAQMIEAAGETRRPRKDREAR